MNISKISSPFPHLLPNEQKEQEAPERTFCRFPSERLGLFPNMPRDIEKAIIRFSCSKARPARQFQELHVLALVSQGFHTVTRTIQAEILNHCHLKMHSKEFISSFKCLLQFAKCYGVIKLSFPSLSEAECMPLVEFPSLTHLKIYRKFSGEYFHHLTSLQELEWLEVSVDNLDVQCLTAFKKLRYLKINLSGRKVENRDALIQLTQLKHLDIFHDDFLEEIWSLKQLKHLHIEVGILNSNKAFQGLGSMICLRHLELGKNLPPSVFSEAAQLTGLESLILNKVGGDRFNQDLMEISNNFQQLQILKIVNCKVSDKSFEGICKITTLRKLHVAYSNVTFDGFKGLTRLKKLSSLHWYGVHKGSLEFIGENLTQLRSLGLRSSALYKSVSHLTSLVNLRLLDISFCKQIESFSTLTEHLKELRYLKVENVSGFKNEFESLLRFKNLEKLDIDADWLGNEHLQKIGENLPDLRVISICSRSFLFDKEAVEKAYPRLSIISSIP